MHPTDTDTDTATEADRVWSPLNLNFFRCLRLNLFAFIIYLSLNSLYCHVKAASAQLPRSLCLRAWAVSVTLSAVVSVAVAVLLPVWVLFAFCCVSFVFLLGFFLALQLQFRARQKRSRLCLQVVHSCFCRWRTHVTVSYEYLSI